MPRPGSGPGHILALHDGIGAATFHRHTRFARELVERRQAEIKALPAIIEAALDDGYRFDTVSELMKIGEPQQAPGAQRPRLDGRCHNRSLSRLGGDPPRRTSTCGMTEAMTTGAARVLDDVIVIGGGHRRIDRGGDRSQAGASVTLVEARSTLGGRGRTSEVDGHLFNEGAHALYDGGVGVEVLARARHHPARRSSAPARVGPAATVRSSASPPARSDAMRTSLVGPGRRPSWPG